MSAEKNAFALSKFFTLLFHNIPKLLLTNILFAVPFAVFFGLFYFINTVTNIHSIFLLFLFVIPLFPFFAGVTQVTAHIAREDDIEIFHNFVAGVKENFLKFLVHGIVFYCALTFSWFSINMYITLARKNGMFYVPMGISILIAFVFLLAFFYIPSMTVTFDLKMKYLYKNSFLMTFGEFKHNLCAIFGLIVLTLVCATALLCCSNGIALIIVTILLFGLIVPSVASFIINSAVYDGMYSIIVNSQRKTDEINRKLENRKKGQLFDADYEPEKNFVPEEFIDIEVDETADGDEFIYYNGKMVKRSVLINMKKAQQKED